MATRSDNYYLKEDYFQETYTNEWDNDLSGETIISPSSNHRLKISGVYVAMEPGASTGYVRLKLGTNTVVKVYDISGGNHFYPFPRLKVRGAKNEALKIDSTLGVGVNFTVHVNYEDEPNNT